MDFTGAYAELSKIPVDWMIIGAFCILIVADALRAGSVRAAALAISFPVSAFLYQMASQTILLSNLSSHFQNDLAQTLIFAVIEAVIFVCLHQMLYTFDPYSSLLSAVVCGLSATAAVLAVWTQLPILQSLWHFGPQIDAIFGTSYRFFWLIGAYLALAFLGG